MRFYCAITRKPNSVIEQVKHGLQVVSQKRLCVFVDGQLDTDDPHVIEKLKERPDLFWIGREDVNYRALDFPQLVYEAERLGISTYRVTKRELLKALIHFERDKERPRTLEELGRDGEVKVKEKVKAPTIEEIKEKARQSVEKAKKDAELLASIESIDEIEVVVKKMGKEDEIGEIERNLKEGEQNDIS